MSMRPLSCAARPLVSFCLLALLVSPGRPASAQTFETVGERALGMAGAFVAVADDATATHWNPAGLATGEWAGMTIEWRRFQSGNQDAPLVPGPTRQSGTFTSLGTLPLGISYGSWRQTRLVPGAADEPVEAASLRVRHAGATILQTVAPGLVVGTTLKVLRGDVSDGPVAATVVGAALDLAADRTGDGQTAFDVDLGVMASSDLIRIGLTWKNLRSPSFGATTGNPMTLPRQARLGVAVTPADGVTLAMDFDLDTVDLAGGLRRMGAVGGEVVLGRRLGIRSGVRWSLVGPRHPVGAVGLSVAVREGFWLDGHYAKGQLDEDHEFGVAMRAGF